SFGPIRCLVSRGRTERTGAAAGKPDANRRRGLRSKPALMQSTQIEWVGVRDDGGGRPSADREAVIRSAISRWRVGLIDIAAANPLPTLQPRGAALIRLAPPPAR